jgi:hypothetical protein
MMAFAIIGVTVLLIVALICLQLSKKTGSLWPSIMILALSVLVLALIIEWISYRLISN